MPTATANTQLQLPHLISYCDAFELRTNPHCRTVADKAKKWVVDSNTGGFLSEQERRAFCGLQATLLISLCYPTCDAAQLLAITQMFTLMIHCMDSSQITAQSAATQRAFDGIWTCLRRTTNADWQTRFRRHLRAFRTALMRTEADSDRGIMPDIESYIALRQDSSGTKLLFDLIEYAEGLRIPPSQHASPLLQRLKSDACNIISWSTDIAAYARIHVARDRHNLVTVLMAERRLPVQTAMHAAGALVKETVQTFLANEHMFLSQGQPVDKDVRRYIQGLRDCIVGAVHWLYETDRFFGDNGDEVRDLGWVFVAAS
ncbi:terpenoid synthase [Laetiporus sulphureus 93-53]|uniref:Terpene synthase n=1 Tax=Laetiporus sulphureus 93-53 TaxID=1314785 RepID=A0A165C073_9APHY|nr:terpenoid synthase [Laetiporus sulphureus 93-53]KZT01964.1 terpenoid synthase [Laetiporus sulphureus 93-53]